MLKKGSRKSKPNREADTAKNREAHGRVEVDSIEEKKRTGELGFNLPDILVIKNKV